MDGGCQTLIRDKLPNYDLLQRSVNAYLVGLLRDTQNLVPHGLQFIDPICGAFAE